MLVVSKGQNNSFDYSDKYILEKVNFCKPLAQNQADKWIIIKKDTDPNQNISGASSTTAWESGQKVDPIAYVSGVEPYVEAYFSINCKDQEYYAKAINAEGFNFPPKLLEKNNGIYLYPITKSDKEFKNEVVKYWDNFELTWYISNNINGPWIEIDESVSDLYVTKGNPITGNAENVGYETFIHHTTLFLSCKNATGLTNDNDIVDNIYSEFLDRDVRKINGNGPMKYWGSELFDLVNFDDCRPVYGFLALENTTCGTWAAFFNDMIRMQGISTSKVSVIEWTTVDWQYYMNFSPNGYQLVNNYISDVNLFFAGTEWNYVGSQDEFGNLYPTAEFAVKDWDENNLVQPRKFVMSESNLNGIPSDIEYSSYINGNWVPWVDSEGAEGQGNDDPKCEFTNHAVVSYNNKYYDPSYGSPIRTNQNEWENKALSFFQAYVAHKVVINGEEKWEKIIWIGELNSNGQQTNFSN